MKAMKNAMKMMTVTKVRMHYGSMRHHTTRHHRQRGTSRARSWHGRAHRTRGSRFL